MRVILESLTKCLPVILVAATAISANAQDNPSSAKKISKTSSSRYKFEESTTKSTPKFSRLDSAVDGAVKSQVQIENSNQTIEPVVALMPESDASTSPRRFAPTINSAAFVVPVQGQVAPPRPVDSQQFVQPTVVQPQNIEPQADSSYFTVPQAQIDVPRPQPSMSTIPATDYYNGTSNANEFKSIYDSPKTIEFSNSNYGNGLVALGSSTSFQKTPAREHYGNLFGMDPSESCDEWNGFCNYKDLDQVCGCGGLKVNPGHLGLKWLRSKDACDQTERCGDRRCNKSCGSENCGDGCGCESSAKTSCTKNCGCRSCKTGGIFGRK
jgi:hypothetical protein